MNPQEQAYTRRLFFSVLGVPLLLIGAGTFGCASKTIEPGHVGVVSVFGEVNMRVYEEGWCIANPFGDWTIYDCRQRSFSEENVPLPTGDQLTSTVDVSVQYRADRTKAVQILRETGDVDAAVNIHMIPKLRSLIREAGRGVPTAEDFFKEETQRSYQTTVRDALAEFCAPKGIIVEDIFLRDIRLPQFVADAIESKKIRQQEGEKQKAELERFRTEQDQKTVQATAEKLAAEQESLKIKLLADARAYEINVQGNALKENPEVLNLRALEKWSGILPQYVGTGSAMPMMNLGGMKQQ